MAPPVRYYCSYFDHRYLPRGLVLMESIWAYNPAARFFVLCFDDECKRMLDQIDHPNITAIPLAVLEEADPAPKPPEAPGPGQPGPFWMHFAFTGPSLFVRPEDGLCIALLLHRRGPEGELLDLDTLRARRWHLLRRFLE